MIPSIKKIELNHIKTLLLWVVLPLLLIVACQTNENKQATDVETEPVVENQPANTEVHVDIIMGKFNPESQDDFVVIDTQYADQKGMYLQKEAYEAFIAMHEAAKKEGVELVIRSATRNFYRQKEIWEAKWTGKRLVDGGENLSESTPDPEERALKILRWSSMPGTSRHHWGTDIDMNAFENEYFESGIGKKVYDWLQNHASAYGYCQPYTPKGAERPYGYNEEKWHWSYTPISAVYLQHAKRTLRNEDIAGFLGSEVATTIDVKQKYIMGVSDKCK